jgi:hypothetical protein
MAPQSGISDAQLAYLPRPQGGDLTTGKLGPCRIQEIQNVGMQDGKLDSLAHEILLLCYFKGESI